MCSQCWNTYAYAVRPSSVGPGCWRWRWDGWYWRSGAWEQMGAWHWACFGSLKEEETFEITSGVVGIPFCSGFSSAVKFPAVTKLLVTIIWIMTVSLNYLLTLRTHSLSGPTGAGAKLGQLVGRVVCSTILGLRRMKTDLSFHGLCQSGYWNIIYYYKHNFDPIPYKEHKSLITAIQLWLTWGIAAMK